MHNSRMVLRYKSPGFCVNVIRPGQNQGKSVGALAVRCGHNTLPLRLVYKRQLPAHHRHPRIVFQKACDPASRAGDAGKERGYSNGEQQESSQMFHESMLTPSLVPVKSFGNAVGGNVWNANTEHGVESFHLLPTLMSWCETNQEITCSDW